MMDLENGKYECKGCDIDITTGGSMFAIGTSVSHEWNNGQIAMIVGGYVRKLYVATDENARVIPTDIHNVIAHYLSAQELLHFIAGGKLHFAISIKDILLTRLDWRKLYFLRQQRADAVARSPSGNENGFEQCE